MKRGRKDVYTQYGCESLRLYSVGEEITSRTVQARFYQALAIPLLHQAVNDYPELKNIYFLDLARMQVKQKPEIIEQLGRMYAQDGYAEEDVLSVARTAAEAIGQGYTVKAVKAYIISGRKTGEW